jgi:hypothetical protein
LGSSSKELAGPESERPDTDEETDTNTEQGNGKESGEGQNNDERTNSASSEPERKSATRSETAISNGEAEEPASPKPTSPAAQSKSGPEE